MATLNPSPESATSDLPHGEVGNPPIGTTAATSSNQGSALLRALVTALARQAARDAWARGHAPEPTRMEVTP
jgi:hypothetical protein